MRRPFLILRYCLALLALGYAGANVYLLVMQRELIFQPSREVLKTPAHLHLRYDVVWVPTGRDDGASLNGWWAPGSDAGAPVLLYLHGNDLNIGANVEHVARLNAMGFCVLIVDYRGYGNSGGGFPSEAQVYEDAETAWNYLIQVRHTKPARTFIYGHSLGAAIAIHLAVTHPEAGGLIVESAFTSMRDMAELSYPFFPVDWLLNQRFDSLAEMPRLHMPVLFIHGEADAIAPYTMSERLYRAAKPPKRLALIPGAGHEDSATVGGARYSNAVREFVTSVEGGR
jgi:pimeloyl-ACP methyl ester carboxylesterase